MSVTISETGNEAAVWLSVSDVAMACHVSERTVRRWVSEGVVQSRMETAGLRESRLILRGSLPGVSADNTPFHATAAPSAVPRPDMAGAVLEGPRINEPTQSLSEAAPMTWRVDALERERDLIAAERDRLVDDMQHLRAQLDRRAEEAARQAAAEEQLRVMLMQLERTNAELAASLCQRALPPATENVIDNDSAPKKIRWWQKVWGTR